jgi:hypothetical protein
VEARAWWSVRGRYIALVLRKNAAPCARFVNLACYFLPPTAAVQAMTDVIGPVVFLTLRTS